MPHSIYEQIYEQNANTTVVAYDLVVIERELCIRLDQANGEHVWISHALLARRIAYLNAKNIPAPAETEALERYTEIMERQIA